MKKQQAALKKYDAYIDRKKYIIFQKNDDTNNHGHNTILETIMLW